MTVSLDTAQAEVLQRLREDRGMKLIKLQITATETHCGMHGATGRLRCKYVMPYGGQPVCAVFPARELKYDDKAGEFSRLPECVEAGLKGEIGRAHV